MHKLLRKLKLKAAPVKLEQPQRVGIPRITFNALTKGGEATLHEKYSANLEPNSTIVVFPISDHSPEPPTHTVMVKVDLLSRAARLMTSSSKLLLVRTNAE